MKIENFNKAETIKRDYDLLVEQSKQIKDALDFKREPKAETFEVMGYGSNQINWDFLDWKQMLKDAQKRVDDGIDKLKKEFEKLD